MFYICQYIYGGVIFMSGVGGGGFPKEHRETWDRESLVTRQKN